MTRRGLAAAPAALLVLALATSTALAAPGDIERLTLSDAGGAPDDPGFDPAITADGSLVAFRSLATNLLPGTDDSNNFEDVFVRNIAGADTLRRSIQDDGSENPSGHSFSPSISADGNRVAFASESSTLIGADGNAFVDVFVRDVTGGSTTRWSVDTGSGAPDAASDNPRITGSGTFLTFESDATDLSPLDGLFTDVFLTAGGGVPVLISESDAGGAANGASLNAVPSADAGEIAFESEASNLLPASEDTNALRDVFVADSGGTSRASVSTAGTQANGFSFAPEISADGQRVAFMSQASNLAPGGDPGFGGVFLRDVAAGTTERIDVTYDGSAPDGVGQTESTIDNRVAISGDGRYVAFASSDDRLVPGDTNGAARDIFVRDTTEDRTIRVNVPEAGGQATQRSAQPAIAADGSTVAFASVDNGLVPGDSDPGISDFFEIFSTELDWARPNTTLTTQPPSMGFQTTKPGPVSYQCSLDGGPYAACTPPWTPALAPGSHVLRARAVDRFGNFDPTPATASVTVASPPGGGTTAQNVPPPVYRKSFNVEPVSGTVFVILPGGRRARLQDLTSIPSGSIVDATRGRVRLFAVDRRGKRYSSLFYAGAFKVLQLRTGIVELRLTGGKLRNCTARNSTAQASRKRRSRRLWGRGKGRFRTRGRNSSAVVRGTWWLTADRCDGTLTRVREGSVTVRDFKRRRNVVVKRGRRYLARP